MENCLQTEGQNIYQHGLSVKDYAFYLIKLLNDSDNYRSLKLPNWFYTYKKHILQSLLPLNIIEEYTVFHDCSKPYCKIIDEDGKQHFPNHAQLSGELWLQLGGNPQAARLMEMDMDIHTLRAENLKEFANRPEAVTLLIVGLAEIHSNAVMFGGTNSTSFKIKFKHLDRRGSALCQYLFGDKNVVD